MHLVLHCEKLKTPELQSSSVVQASNSSMHCRRPYRNAQGAFVFDNTDHDTPASSMPLRTTTTQTPPLKMARTTLSVDDADHPSPGDADCHQHKYKLPGTTTWQPPAAIASPDDGDSLTPSLIQRRGRSLSAPASSDDVTTMSLASPHDCDGGPSVSTSVPH